MEQKLEAMVQDRDNSRQQVVLTPDGQLELVPDHLAQGKTVIAPTHAQRQPAMRSTCLSPATQRCRLMFHFPPLRVRLCRS